MPNPVLALPCGSRSTTSTARPVAPSAVPRLIAVVVLPTPPFWLAMASTRAWATGSGWFARGTADLADDQDLAVRVAQACPTVHGHLPGFAREGQFRLRRPPFQEQADRTGPQLRFGERQQLRQRCQGARGHDVGAERRQILDPGRVDD